MLKFNTRDEIKNWFSSDWHLGHQREFVWKDRGHNSVKEHVDSVIDTTNEYVGENDRLYYLGDYCLNTEEDVFQEYIDRIKCKNIYMLWGNHNNPVERVYKNLIQEKYGDRNLQVYPFKYKNIIFMGHYMEMSINKQIIVLMHYPISIWNYMKDGSYMLCGHSHYSYNPTTKEHTNGKTLDVGWDGHGRPYEFSEIVEIMKYKNLKREDHHVN